MLDVAVVPVPVPVMPLPSNSNTPYLIAIVAMTALGVFGTVAILLLRPQADNAALYVAIAGFVAPTTAALLAFMKTRETHTLVNSRMDEFKSLLARNAATEGALSRAQGVNQGLREQPPATPAAVAARMDDVAWQVVPMLLLDLQRRVILAISRPAEQIFGYTEGALIGTAFETVVPDPGSLDAAGTVPLTGRRQDGTPFKLVLQFKPVTQSGRAAALAVIAEAK